MRVFLFLMLAAGAHAAVIYTTFGPSDAFNLVNGYGVGGSIQQAGNFVSGANYEVTSVRVGTMQNNVVDSFQVALYSGSTEPTTLLEAQSASFTQGAPPGITTVNFSSTSIQPGETYWLVISGGIGGSWQFNNQGFLGDAVNTAGTWLVRPADVAPAFEINGDILDAPEPASTWLLAAGLLAVGGLRARRRA